MPDNKNRIAKAVPAWLVQVTLARGFRLEIEKAIDGM